jgi:hypothetical protein
LASCFEDFNLRGIQFGGVVDFEISHMDGFATGEFIS